jgi:hypothetical protein
MALMSLTLDKTIPTVADHLASPLAKYITLAAHDCGYSGTAEELIVACVHPLFLKAHSAASKADYPVGAKLQEANLLTNIRKQ